jgi:ABC-2 type transport system permease protein
VSAPDIFDGAEARILDRGYRSYTGERTGVSGSIRSVVIHSIQRGLGLRRTIWAKVLPVLTVAIAYVPAIVFVGIVALVPARNLTDFVLPTYGEYYGYVISAILLFVAFAAPEMLCTDRRSGMLGIYLASPLDRDSYLLAKAIAVAATLAVVCLGPPLLMLVANVLQGQGPEGLGESLLTLLRVVGAGTMITLIYTGVTMGVASLTDRKSIATAGVILLLLVSATIGGTLADVSDNDNFLVVSVSTLSLDIGPRVHGESNFEQPEISSAVSYLAWFVWTAGGFALARFQLRRLPVTR